MRERDVTQRGVRGVEVGTEVDFETGELDTESGNLIYDILNEMSNEMNCRRKSHIGKDSPLNVHLSEGR